MKAWTISDQYGECGTSIVFAETSGKARYYALHNIDSFEYMEWTDLKAKRFPEYDKYYNGKEEVDFWHDDEHRVRLVKDFGWTCVEVYDDECRECPASKWCSY